MRPIAALILAFFLGSCAAAPSASRTPTAAATSVKSPPVLIHTHLAWKPARLCLPMGGQ